MPYIKPEDREQFDSKIDDLAHALREGCGDICGNMNYIITTLIMKSIKPSRYRQIAEITGVLENVKQEFYRKMVAPYEDKKIEENGEVY